MVDKETLIRNFSRCAHLYDRYANIQRMAADELMKDVPRDGISSILEIGCGTGNYTLALYEAFKAAHIRALDISEAMIDIAKVKLQGKGIEFVVGDGERVEMSDRFGLITSNAAFQWFENLEGAIANYKEALNDGGAIAFSTFGPRTFWELDRCLEEVDEFTSSSFFLTRDALEEMLKRYFPKVSVREILVKEFYNSLIELLKKIKYTGARGNGLTGSFFWRRSVLRRIEETYRIEFGGLEASYQIFICKAILEM